MIFEEDYFIDSKISAYEDYRTKDYSDLADNLIDKCKLDFFVLDFGCATGQLVKCLREKKILNVIGTDISFWGIEYGRENYNLSHRILQHYNRQLLQKGFEWTLFLDVLEHIEQEELIALFSILKSDKIVVRVPVIATEDSDDYVLEIHRKDKTHIQRKTKKQWDDFFGYWGFNKRHTFNESSIYESEGVLARIYEKE